MVMQAFSTFIIILDSLISQMKNRFSDDHCLVPSILKQNGTKSIYDITEDLLQWKKYIPFPASLQNEFRRWQLLWCTKNDVPDTFLHALACCDVDSFPNIYQLLVIACTLPVTSAEADVHFHYREDYKII